MQSTSLLTKAAKRRVRGGGLNIADWVGDGGWLFVDGGWEWLREEENCCVVKTYVVIPVCLHKEKNCAHQNIKIQAGGDALNSEG